MLADYLASVASDRWDWGTMDCGGFVGRWIAIRTGLDPLKAVRGTYSTPNGLMRLARLYGGLEGFVQAQMDSVGIKRTAVVEDGDVALIMTGHMDDVSALTGGSLVISSGPFWVGKTMDGLSYIRADAITVWRIA